MEGTILPLTFYCRNARLCLKKAIAARKFQLPAQELSHLRKFLNLVAVVLPCHPLFLEPRHHKACEELQRHLDGTRSRIKELEQEVEQEQEAGGASSTGAECVAEVVSKSLRRPESSVTPRIHGRSGRGKRRLDSSPPPSCATATAGGCRKKSWEYLANLQDRYPYAFSRRHRSAPSTRRSTPVSRRTSKQEEEEEPCWECPGVEESVKSATSCRPSGDMSFPSCCQRKMPRLGALGIPVTQQATGCVRQEPGEAAAGSKRLRKSRSPGAKARVGEEGEGWCCSSVREASVVTHKAGKRSSHGGVHVSKGPRFPLLGDKKKARRQGGGGGDECAAGAKTAEKGSSVSSTDDHKHFTQGGDGSRDAILLERTPTHSTKVSQECERFRQEMRCLQARAQDAAKEERVKFKAEQPRQVTDDGGMRGGAVAQGEDDDGDDDDDAASTSSSSSSKPTKEPGLGILQEPLLSPKELAAEREKVIHLLHRSTVWEDKSMGREKGRARVSCKLPFAACVPRKDHSSSSSSSPFACDKSGDDSSLSLSHYARKLHQRHGSPDDEDDEEGAAHDVKSEHKAEPASSACSPILLPLSLHTSSPESGSCLASPVPGSVECVLGGCSLGASKRSNPCSSPVRQDKTCFSFSSFPRSTRKASKPDVKEDSPLPPKASKLPPPASFFVDLSDKATSGGDGEDQSWRELQEELKKNVSKRKMNGIASGIDESRDYLGNRLVSFVSQKLQTLQNDLYEKKISSLNRLVGELKGSVEGFRIRIEVEGEGWRGRVVGLEKELECLKDEREEEVVDIKNRLVKELKAKVEQIVAEKVETDECRRERLVEEMRCFKAEIGSFVREASKKVFMQEVDKMLADHHDAEIADTRADVKKELQNFLEEKLDKAMREALENPNGYFRKHLQHIRRAAAEVKLESQGLKKLEEALKAESKHVRKVVTRLEKDDMKRNVEMEELRRMADDLHHRPKTGGCCKKEESRERLLIMERVENLSQMYLGGLEEVRSDLYSVKRSCRDRVHALESQWSEFQRQHLVDKDGSSTACSGQLPKKYMLQELHRFREQLEDMKLTIKEHGKAGSVMCDMDNNSNACLQGLVETERAFVRGLLERESSLIRGQVIDICEANKNEIAGILKAEVQKRMTGLKDKTDSVTCALNADLDLLKRGLVEVQEGAEEVATTLRQTQKDREKANAAAREACEAASRATDVLEQVMGSFTNDMSNARRKTVELQEGLISEARRSIADVQQQREMAVAAVAEARASSEKVESVLQEVVGSFSTEMGQAKRKSIMLQENLEKEILKVKSTVKEMESTSARAGKAVADFHGDMEGARRRSLQLQEGLEKELQSFVHNMEGEKKRLSVTFEEAASSVSQKLLQEQEATKEELRHLVERVDAIAGSQIQRVEEKASRDLTTREESLRFCVLEQPTFDASAGQLGLGDGVSLRLEHVEKRASSGDPTGRHEVLSIQHKGGGISVSLPFRADAAHAEVLQGGEGDERADTGGCASLDDRLTNLENRLENVASATFSNLRLLDGKVESVSLGVQAALEGAACSENKCAALGVELVKVFRMLARRPGSAAASPGSDYLDQGRGNMGNEQHGSAAPFQQDQSTIAVRQANMRRGCPVHDRQMNDADWHSSHQEEQHMTHTSKDAGPANAKGDSQRTKIKLDGGRIQVNVTSHHRHNKRPAPGSDIILVQ